MSRSSRGSVTFAWFLNQQKKEKEKKQKEEELMRTARIKEDKADDVKEQFEQRKKQEMLLMATPIFFGKQPEKKSPSQKPAVNIQSNLASLSFHDLAKSSPSEEELDQSKHWS